MATVGDIWARLRIDARDFTAGLERASQSIKNVGADAGKAAGLLTGYATAVLGGFLLAAKTMMDFETEMRHVNTTLLASEEEFAKLEEAILSLSEQVAMPAAELAKGMYVVASSGYQGADSLKILAAAAKAAVGGMAPLEDVIKVVTGTMMAYGYAGERAEYVTDVMTLTAQRAKMSFMDLAQQMGEIVSAAARAQLSLEDVGAALIVMTRAGIVPSEAFTSLNRTILAIVKPQEKAAQTAKDLGVAFSAEALATKGLHGVFKDIGEKLKLNTAHIRGMVQATANLDDEQAAVALSGAKEITFMAKLFPQIRALRGALGMAANEGKNFAGAYAEMTNSLGKTNDVFAEMMKTTKKQLDEGAMAAQHFLILIGKDVKPAILAIDFLVDSLARLGLLVPGWLRSAAVGIIALTAALAAATAGFIMYDLWLKKSAIDSVYLTLAVAEATKVMFSQAAALGILRASWLLLSTAITASVASLLRFLASPVGVILMVTAAVSAIAYATFKSVKDHEKLVEEYWKAVDRMEALAKKGIPVPKAPPPPGPRPEEPAVRRARAMQERAAGYGVGALGELTPSSANAIQQAWTDIGDKAAKARVKEQQALNTYITKSKELTEAEKQRVKNEQDAQSMLSGLSVVRMALMKSEESEVKKQAAVMEQSLAKQKASELALTMGRAEANRQAERIAHEQVYGRGGWLEQQSQRIDAMGKLNKKDQALLKQATEDAKRAYALIGKTEGEKQAAYERAYWTTLRGSRFADAYKGILQDEMRQAQTAAEAAAGQAGGDKAKRDAAASKAYWDTMKQLQAERPKAIAAAVAELGGGQTEDERNKELAGLQKLLEAQNRLWEARKLQILGEAEAAEAAAKDRGESEAAQKQAYADVWSAGMLTLQRERAAQVLENEGKIADSLVGFEDQVAGARAFMHRVRIDQIKAAGAEVTRTLQGMATTEAEKQQATLLGERYVHTQTMALLKREAQERRDAAKQQATSVVEAWKTAASQMKESGELTADDYLKSMGRMLVWMRQFDAARASAGLAPAFYQQELEFATQLATTKKDSVKELSTLERQAHDERMRWAKEEQQQAVALFGIESNMADLTYQHAKDLIYIAQGEAGDYSQANRDYLDSLEQLYREAPTGEAQMGIASKMRDVVMQMFDAGQMSAQEAQDELDSIFEKMKAAQSAITDQVMEEYTLRAEQHALSMAAMELEGNKLRDVVGSMSSEVQSAIKGTFATLKEQYRWLAESIMGTKPSAALVGAGGPVTNIGNMTFNINGEAASGDATLARLAKRVADYIAGDLSREDKYRRK